MFTHLTWLKFALWNVLQNTESPQSSQLLSTFTTFWGGIGDANSHIWEKWYAVFPVLYSTCFSPFSSTEFQIHVLKCTLWDIHGILLHGIVKKTKKDIFSPVDVPVPINFAGPIVHQQIPIPMCGLSWCHMTFSIFPMCTFHTAQGVEQECCHGKKKKEKLLLLITSCSGYMLYLGVQKSDVGQAMFWHVNMLLVPDDSVLWLDVCSCCSVKKRWCAVSTIYKMSK